MFLRSGWELSVDDKGEYLAACFYMHDLGAESDVACKILKMISLPLIVSDAEGLLGFVTEYFGFLSAVVNRSSAAQVSKINARDLYSEPLLYCIKLSSTFAPLEFLLHFLF